MNPVSFKVDSLKHLLQLLNSGIKVVELLSAPNDTLVVVNKAGVGEIPVLEVTLVDESPKTVYVILAVDFTSSLPRWVVESRIFSIDPDEFMVTIKKIIDGLISTLNANASRHHSLSSTHQIKNGDSLETIINELLSTDKMGMMNIDYLVSKLGITITNNSKAGLDTVYGIIREEGELLGSLSRTGNVWVFKPHSSMCGMYEYDARRDVKGALPAFARQLLKVALTPDTPSFWVMCERIDGLSDVSNEHNTIQNEGGRGTVNEHLSRKDHPSVLFDIIRELLATPPVRQMPHSTLMRLCHNGEVQCEHFGSFNGVLNVVVKDIMIGSLLSLSGTWVFDISLSTLLTSDKHLLATFTLQLLNGIYALPMDTLSDSKYSEYHDIITSIL